MLSFTCVVPPHACFLWRNFPGLVTTVFEGEAVCQELPPVYSKPGQPPNIQPNGLYPNGCDGCDWCMCLHSLTMIVMDVLAYIPLQLVSYIPKHRVWLMSGPKLLARAITHGHWFTIHWFNIQFLAAVNSNIPSRSVREHDKSPQDV